MDEQTKQSLLWTVGIIGVLAVALGLAFAFGWIPSTTGG